MPLVDLTQPFSSGMGSSPDASLERRFRIEDHGLNATMVAASVHAGTHLDAPSHFYERGRTIEQLSLAETCGPAVCWHVDRGPGEPILASDLEEQSPRLKDGDILFLHTGWDRHFEGDQQAYEVHPYLSEEAAGWLVDRRIKLLGVDFTTPDLPMPLRAASPGFNWPVHRLLLGNSVLIAEHLAHLEQVVGRRFFAFVLPVPYVGSDGAPARVVAEL